MLAKTYLIVVGLMYLGLAIWCCLQPTPTSRKVGFELIGGSGQSEFMTVYGGLEFGIGLILLAAAWRTDAVLFGVWACVALHGSLVVFRTISFLRFSDIDPFTYRLAAGEWVILLLGSVILWRGWH